jgi:TonB family protein
MKSPAHRPHVLSESATKPAAKRGYDPIKRRLFRVLALVASCALGAYPVLRAQEATPAPAPATPPAPMPPAVSTPAPPIVSSDHSRPGETTEDELRQLLVGKQLFLRGGYLGDSLSFNEHGDAIGHPTVGSFTLSGVEIEKVHLSKHKVELIGDRYALHFLGATPYEDSVNAVDRVKITPKKKTLRITIDREQVAKEKKAKEEHSKAKHVPAAPAPGATQTVSSSETDVAGANAPAPQPASVPDPSTQLTAEDKADLPADQASVTTTTSPAHAAQVLRAAIDKVFATGVDDQVRAHMPEFWQLYYQAQAAGVDYRPKDASILRSNAVDSQAKVLSSIAPDSNEFAQASGIAGRALYRVVIGADGTTGEIAVIRPIGFGLDENAVAAIRKASFEPATKAGKPVAETLDLAVLFRIYSKRTSVAASETKAAEPVKPGPYTVQAQPQPPAQPQQ